MVKKEVIGEKIINFILGKRDSAEEESKETKESDDGKEPNEKTRVLVNGYDVTGKAVDETTRNDETSEGNAKEEKGFFERLISWMFG